MPAFIRRMVRWHEGAAADRASIQAQIGKQNGQAKYLENTSD
jgi:hypothetical protein